MLRAGQVPAPATLAALVAEHRGAEAEILGLLHVRFGNGYVQSVLSAMPAQRGAAPVPAAPALGGTPTSPGATPPATTSATPTTSATTGDAKTNTPQAAGGSIVDVRLDKHAEAARLHMLVIARDQAGIVTLLEANAHPEHLYALLRAYPGRLVDDVRKAVTNKSLRARAFAYLGEQLSVDARILDQAQGDVAEILRDLDRIDDAHALALLEGDGSTIAGQGRPRWLAATTSWTAVQEALHDQLGADDYYRAMHALIEKAARAQSARRAAPTPANAPIALDLDRAPIAIVGASANPVHQARIELAEQRIRGADGAGDWLLHPALSSPAYLALADLSKPERAGLVQRLEVRPLKNFGATSLLSLAREPDDATVIAKADPSPGVDDDRPRRGGRGREHSRIRFQVGPRRDHAADRWTRDLRSCA